jgi:hypothetical protein
MRREPQVEHRRGCPARRMEAYVVERGVTAGLATAQGDGTVRGTPASVIRCQDCAEQVVVDDGGAANEAFRRGLR